jgi:hypothetical protein
MFDKFLLEPKVEVTLTRKDFGLATRTYPVGTVIQPVETNVYNPVTDTLDKHVVAQDTRIIATSTSV